MIPNCCGGLEKVDFSQANMSVLYEIMKHVDLKRPRFCMAVVTIAFNPFFWNVVARWEHRTRSLSRLIRSPYLACYCMGITILLLNVYRSHSITAAIEDQPKLELLDSVCMHYTGAVFVLVGSLLVISSFLGLGFTGTFLGDYFGILMEQKVTGFPFNLLENPMYWGSTANYLGLALMNASLVGVLLTAVVALCYKVAIAFERMNFWKLVPGAGWYCPTALEIYDLGASCLCVFSSIYRPFTEKIYQQRRLSRKRK